MSSAQATAPHAQGAPSYAEVAAAPPPTSSGHHSRPETSGKHRHSKQPRELLGFLRLQGMQHWLRLRKKLVINDVSSLELGVDLNLKSQRYMPHAALSYDILRKDGRQIATLRATRQSLFLRKTFNVCPPKVSFNLHTMAGISYKGQPEFALDVDNVRPVGLVIGAAVALLALGKPLAGSRGFGGLQYGLPRLGDVTAKAESKAMVERRGKGLLVSLKQVNAVLRF